MILNLFLYFAVGVLQDILWTFNVKAVSERKVWRASTYSFLTTIMSFFVFYDILEKLDTTSGMIAIFVYALGVSVGTYFAMEYEKIFKIGRARHSKKARLAEATAKRAVLGTMPVNQI